MAHFETLKMANTFTSDHVQLVYSGHVLLRNLLAAIFLFPCVNMALLSPYTALVDGVVALVVATAIVVAHY